MSLNVYSNGALSKICGNFIVDSVLSKTSNNAIANAPVATKFEEIEQQMGSQDFTGTTAEVQAAIQAGTIDDDTIVYITDDSQESSATASDITYDDGTVSGTTVQDALENAAGKFYATEAAAEADLANIEDGQMVYTDDGDETIAASNIEYDNTTSGMSATSVQGAVDELNNDLTNLESTLNEKTTPVDLTPIWYSVHYTNRRIWLYRIGKIVYYNIATTTDEARADGPIVAFANEVRGVNGIKSDQTGNTQVQRGFMNILRNGSNIVRECYVSLDTENNRITINSEVALENGDIVTMTGYFRTN